MKRAVVIFFIGAILLISVVYAGLDAKDGKVINVAAPTEGTDAVNKDYVDAHIVASHTPATTSGTGTLGTVSWDNRYIYVWIGNNNVMRMELEAWGDSLLLETGDLILEEEGREIIVEK